MILLTRPYEDSKTTAQKLKNMGHETHIMPMFEVEDITTEIPNKNFDAIVITSRHSARTAKNLSWISKTKQFVVGEKTAIILPSPYMVAQNSSDLLSTMQNELPKGAKILYLTGDHIADNFDQKLIDSGFELTTQQVYKTIATTINQQIPDDISHILFFSPRTAELFSANIQDSINAQALCISQNTANKLRQNQFKSVIIAPEPTEESLLSLL